MSDWLAAIPKITGISVAAFVSFGGPEGNQHNALCHILHLLAEKEGIPVGMEAFRSIPSYPATWDSANQRSGEHLPDEATYNRVREFAGEILEAVRQGRVLTYSSELALREIVRMLPLVWLNKRGITQHTVDGAKCILCRTCEKMSGERHSPGKAFGRSRQMPGLLRLPEQLSGGRRRDGVWRQKTLRFPGISAAQETEGPGAAGVSALQALKI